ncbi:MAG TPA: inositol monophosphatase family protein [Desulfohalobiaceae bacterium]|nr:inositol monophosphatase family protein [Desulfohalobiaceae bacterium]
MNKGTSYHTISLEERFLDVFRLGALQVGRLAEALQPEITPYQKAGHESPEGAALTVVDLVSQDIFLYLINQFLPGIAVDAEEETELVHKFPVAQIGGTFIVIDPIDGTLNYSQGSKDYAVMGALIQENHYTAALVYFPALKEMYWAQRSRGAWGQKFCGHPYSLQIATSKKSILVPPHVTEAKKKLLQDSGIDFSISRCSGSDAIAPAIDRAKASITERRLDRRRGIGYLITSEAGGCVMIGDNIWTGQDPLTLPDDHGLNIIADSFEYGKKLLAILNT